MPSEPFWIVVCDYKPAAGGPKGYGGGDDFDRAMRPAERPHRHTTEVSAIREAVRLTRACQTQAFYVFKVVVGVKPPPRPDVAFIQFVGEPDFDTEIPF